jgi:anti-anti-sigma factor
MISARPDEGVGSMRFLISAQRDGTGSGGPSWRLSLIGDIDLAACQGLTKALDEVLSDEGASGVVVDLGRTTFLDCSGIGALVYGRNLATERGRSYAIENATGLPLHILTLTEVLDPPPPTSAADPDTFVS